MTRNDMLSLRWKLARLRQRVTPDAAFVRALNKKLFQDPWFQFRYVWAPRIAVSACTILLTAGAGTSVYAYSSDQVLPQHPLYGLRLALEQVEVRLTPASHVQAVETEQRQRRAHEADLAVSKGLPMDDRFAEQVIQSVDQDPEAQIMSDGMEELLNERDALSPEEKSDIDRVAYEQAKQAMDEESSNDDNILANVQVDVTGLEKAMDEIDGHKGGR